MTNPPDIEKALAALNEEMGRYGVRQTPLGPRGRYVRWEKLHKWCLAHPGVGVTLDEVYANLPHRLRKRFPDLTIEGSNHRYEEGRRLATMYAIYEPATDA